LRAGAIESVDDVSSLERIAQVPFMTKADLREHYPFGLFTVPREQIVRLHASSGTHGKPTLVGYTAGDLDRWTELVARCMTTAGVRRGMLVHNANGYGLFTGGLGFHQGAERLGATVLPVSGGFTARQVTLLSDLGADVLVATPSYALALANAVAEAGVDPARLSLKFGMLGGEPWTERMRAQIEALLPLKAMNTYGLSEMCGPGVAAECVAARDGLHVQEDHFLAEVVDPHTGAPLPAGEEGELVFTTLTKEAMPLIRYRTRDIGRLDPEPCVCGRTTARLHGLGGRLDDMLIVRGVNIHPSNVEHILLGIDGVAPHYRLIVHRSGAMDELTVECEPSGDHDRELLRVRVEQILREHTGLRITVSVLEPGAVPRSEGKAVRVLDRRPD
jgi:phenylacetate-CoA ligase